MSILLIHQLFTSPRGSWEAVGALHPSVATLLAYLVVPMSLIPPLMLGYAGRDLIIGDLPYGGAQDWGRAVTLFFLAELLSVPLMAWGIRYMARVRKVACDYHDAFTLAAIAPAPMWLSALGLFAGSQAIAVAMALAGLAGSVLLIFRGVEGILKVREGGVAFDIAYRVTALGAAAWMILILFLLAPLYAN